MSSISFGHWWSIIILGGLQLGVLMDGLGYWR